MKSTYKFILLFLATFFIAGSAVAQKSDTIFTKIHDTILCTVHKEEYGLLKYYPKGDYNLVSIDYRDVNRIVLRTNNLLYLGHMIDKNGYMLEKYKPKTAPSSKGYRQQDYLSETYKSDSVIFSDSAVVAMLAAAGTELVAFKDEYYTGMKQILGGSIATLAGGGFATYFVFIVAAPEVIAFAGFITAVGVIFTVVGTIKTITAIKRAGNAGEILRSAQKFYFPRVAE